MTDLGPSTPIPPPQIGVRNITLYKQGQLGDRNITLYQKRGFNDNDDLIRMFAALGIPSSRLPRRFPEPHLPIRAGTSLRRLQRERAPKNLFPSPSNGEPAYGEQARGAADDEVKDIPRTKPSGLVNLDRNRQIITRLQSLRISETFPLLSLSAELRLMVYEYCISFAGVEKWFDDCWTALRDSDKPSKVDVPTVARVTPTILLVCKQVYLEARELLKKQSISFHHGLLDIESLDNFMNTSILTNIASITIDCKGHVVLPEHDDLVGPSWRGHLDLIVDVSNILAKGHSLKTFTLDLTDPTLREHVTHCMTTSTRCDFREQIVECLAHLRKIRNVKNVNLRGIPESMIADLKARMQSPGPSLFDLPGELRNQIYAYAANWSDISINLARTMSTWATAFAADPKATPAYPKRSTPTILLLNKQITKEAQSIIRGQPLTLTMVKDRNIQTQSEVLNVMKLINPGTLAQIQHLDIRIESWEWVYALDRVLPHLAKKHNLKTLKFTFADSLKKTFLGQGKKYPDHTLSLSLSAMAKIRGVGCVEIKGDLPDVFTQPLKMIMESPEVVGEVLPELRTVTQEGIAEEVDDEEA